ncbi:uncharacterized protein IAS62_000987 [Cryptococcus decagattii]|uniref:Enoyl reductase (ER) domain-containing protein n=1 Tax=Cryptococcus decagattii TaxID=1859122 RepID=A0ABZ2AQF3_9TREE
MKAVAYTRYGGPEVTQICSFPIPLPKKGEVQRGGEFKYITPWTMPVIAGNEFSGIVTVVGDYVTKFAVGDRVVCRTTKSAMGGLGTYVVMPASLVAKAPTTVDLVDAAGLPLAGLTAQQALEKLDVKAGDRILITGGAGGVGLFAIQLAKIRGAHITATASDAGKPYVLKAGADTVIDYRNQKLADLPEKFVKVFDVAGGEEALINDVIPAVAQGGHIVSVAGHPTPGLFDTILPVWKSPLINLVLSFRSRTLRNAAASHGVRYEYFFMRPDGLQLEHLCNLIDEEHLRDWNQVGPRAKSSLSSPTVRTSRGQFRKLLTEQTVVNTLCSIIATRRNKTGGQRRPDHYSGVTQRSIAALPPLCVISVRTEYCG